MARAAFSIRPGSPRDAPTIVALIRELAMYERLLHEVEITPAAVRRHGFGRRPRIGARLDKEWIITRLKGAPLTRLARPR